MIIVNLTELTGGDADAEEVLCLHKVAPLRSRVDFVSPGLVKMILDWII